MSLVSAPAFAGGTPPAGPQTLGEVITNLGVSLGVDGGSFLNVLAAFSYIAGIFYAAHGIFLFKQHVDLPHQHPISAGVKRFLVGGMFLTLPFMGEVVYGSLFADSGEGYKNTGRDSFDGITIDATDGLSLDEMVVNLMTDIGAPVETLLQFFAYLSAIIFLMVGISRLTKRIEEGPKGPAGMGTIMTFIVSGALFGFGDMAGSFSSTLFGSASAATSATIDASLGLAADDAEKIQAVIEAVMMFVMMVGAIAFIRGWFVLRAFADGAQGATLAQGLTFLFGGALAMNLGDLINVLQASLGISGLTFG